MATQSSILAWSLVGYSAWCRKGETRLSMHAHTQIWNTEFLGAAGKMELRRQFGISLSEFKMSKWQVRKLLFML